MTHAICVGDVIGETASGERTMTSHVLRTEPMQIIHDHMLVERAGRLAILDTGVPESMDCPELVSEVLGVTVDRLIGCAELAEAPLQIDWPGRRIVHGASPSPDQTLVPLTRAAFGIPLIPVQTPLGRVDAVLDTGAALSYAPPEAVRGLDPVRETDDFLPGLGSFTVDVYRLDVSVGGIPLEVEFGVMPPLLRMALSLLCPGGWIIGSALFRDRVVTLDLGRSEIHLGRVAMNGATARSGVIEHIEHIVAGATLDDSPTATRGPS